MQLGEPPCGGWSHQYHQYHQSCVLGAMREDLVEGERGIAVGAEVEVGVGAECGAGVEEDAVDAGGGHEVWAAVVRLGLHARNRHVHLQR